MSAFDGFARPPCADTLGWTLLEEDPARRRIRVAFEGRAAFCNPGGYIQGGFLAAMLDDTLGPALVVATGGTHHGTTIDLNVRFLAPAAPGKLTGEGRVVQLGKTIAFLEGELRDERGIIVARANASVRVVSTSALPRV